MLVKILCVKLVDCLLFSHFMCCKAIIIIFYISSDISRVEPNVGSAEGGTLITIHGKHFNDPRNDVQVKVGGQSLSYCLTCLPC